MRALALQTECVPIALQTSSDDDEGYRWRCCCRCCFCCRRRCCRRSAPASAYVLLAGCLLASLPACCPPTSQPASCRLLANFPLSLLRTIRVQAELVCACVSVCVCMSLRASCLALLDSLTAQVFLFTVCLIFLREQSEKVRRRRRLALSDERASRRQWRGRREK